MGILRLEHAAVDEGARAWFYVFLVFDEFILIS